MARYQRQQALGSIANPRTSEAQATMQLADTLQQFGQFGMERYAQHRMDAAKESAGEADIKAGEELELLSNQTMYGRQYNQLVKQAYSAATRNDYTKSLNQLSLEHPNDIAAFESAADAYTAETLNSAPMEMRNFMKLDMEAMREKYAQGIRARQAEDAIAAGVMESDAALEGLATDAYDDLRQGRDDTFLMRREAYVGFVNNSAHYSEVQKQQRIQAFDKNADKYYHKGEVERLLQAGRVGEAIKYKNKLAQGSYKTFGESEADRDAVMADIDADIHKYFQQQNMLEAEYEDNMNDRYRDNANKLDVMIQKGEATTSDILDWQDRGLIGRQEAYSLRNANKARASQTITDEAFEYEFALRAPGMTNAEAMDFINQGVSSGRLNGGDAKSYLDEIRSGKYSVLNTFEGKQATDFLRKSLQIDNDMIDLQDSGSVLRARTVQMYNDLAAGGEITPREAANQAFAWYRNQTADVVDFELRASQIKTVDDFKRAAIEYNQMKKTLTPEEKRRITSQLKAAQARLKAESNIEVQ